MEVKNQGHLQTCKQPLCPQNQVLEFQILNKKWHLKQFPYYSHAKQVGRNSKDIQQDIQAIIINLDLDVAGNFTFLTSPALTTVLYLSENLDDWF